MTKNIGSIDKNLKAETAIGEADLRFYDVRRDPFCIYGLHQPQEETDFKRLPDDLAQQVGEGVAILAHNTSGGRARFRTNSRYVAIKAVFPNVTPMPRMALTGTSGFDLYCCEDGRITYYGTFVPPLNMTDGYESILYFPDNRERDLLIHFPLYNDVSALYVGLEESADVSAGGRYRDIAPVFYYGSSITQGGCATRPGNNYEAMISRRYNCDYRNFGFSGKALGEENLLEYLAQLDFSVFVLDYDHNAPSAKHLLATHKRAYEIIRRRNPEKPIILISKPDVRPENPEDRERRNIVYSTYCEASRSGDDNVYFIDGCSLFGGEYRDCCTVDGCHPNDLGFSRMADLIGRLVGDLLR